jgi:uncharacterized protein YcbK (DUF882 family)
MVAAGSLTLLNVSTAQSAVGVRSLSFHNLHTGENLKATYFANGEHLPDALAEINHILRDFRTNAVWPMDISLLNLLHRVRMSLGTDEPYHIISGYRSPVTNLELANNSGGVARQSLHLAGKAIDVRLPGRSLRNLRQAALAERLGGVGFYPKSGFVHLDVGRVRFW